MKGTPERSPDKNIDALVEKLGFGSADFQMDDLNTIFKESGFDPKDLSGDYIDQLLNQIEEELG